jgi:hypothetical protein
MIHKGGGGLLSTKSRANERERDRGGDGGIIVPLDPVLRGVQVLCGYFSLLRTPIFLIAIYGRGWMGTDPREQPSQRHVFERDWTTSSL